MIPAEPNDTRIKFEILGLSQDKEFAGKFNLEIKVLQWANHEDQRFIKPEENYHAFTFEAANTLQPGDVLTADAGYIGGPTAGTVHLKSLAAE